MGHDVEIVNFVPMGTTLKKAIFTPSKRSMVSKMLRFIPLTICNITQTIIMHRFIDQNLHLTKRTYSDYSELLSSCPEADLYISGSDQIWNTQNLNLSDDIKAYYLCFAPNNKPKIAYASSFGKTDFSPEEKTDISAWLSRYYAISVREDTAVGILDKLGIKNCLQVLDPTLLLTKEEWLSFIQKKAPAPGYLFVYNLNRNPLMSKLALKIAQKKRLRIVNFADTYYFIRSANNRIINTAYDFINYIAHADYIVTDSFHGTAFSLNFGRQFICIHPPKYSCRLESLLRLTKLSDRLVTTENEGVSKAQTVIPIQNVSQLLNDQREISKDFLTNVLKSTY
jgi:polysaccharide pyruvyl transferase WcaK-like protein